MWLRHVTFHMTIYGKSPISPTWKIKHIFLVTFRTLTAQILVLQPCRQLGYLNSNLMLRLDVHFNLLMPKIMKRVSFAYFVCKVLYIQWFDLMWPEGKNPHQHVLMKPKTAAYSANVFFLSGPWKTEAQKPMTPTGKKNPSVTLEVSAEPLRWNFDTVVNAPIFFLGATLHTRCT